MTELRPGAVALAFVLTLMVTGCQDEATPQDEGTQEAAQAGPAADDPAVGIRRVLDTDSALSNRYVSRRRSSDYEVWLKGQRTYAAAMGAISLEGTPVDFADAFRSHQAAWAAYTDFLTGLSEDELSVDSTRDRARKPDVEATRRKSLRLDREISTTWFEVEMVASTFGVGKGPALRAPPTPVGSTDKLIRLQGSR